jgi:chemotaxis protein MotB
MAALGIRTEKLDRELVDANTVIAADREKIELQLRTIASLKRDIIALQTVRNELESKVGALADTLKERDQALTESDQSLRERGLVLKERDEALKKQDLALKKQDQSLTATRDRNNELEARLSTEAERTRLAQKDISEKDVNLRNLMRRAVEGAVALTKEQKLSAEARRQLGLLNRQIAALRQQLARIAVALEASEAKAKAQNVQIVNLGKRLNAALVSKVEELARYRSEFFGKLRQALGNQAGIRIVGDRFVFQSEVLFESGSATLVGTAGRQIRRIAEILKQVAARIPADVDWVLRVDGHTDRNPIKTPQFPSNWELSTGRAISVVKQLIALGIPPERLAPTGFGEHRPLDTGDTIQAHSRNRRIEFKLTGR